MRRLRQYLGHGGFLDLIVLGLLYAVYVAADVGRQLESQLQPKPTVSRDMIPTHLGPMETWDQQGQAHQIWFRDERTLLAVFNPEFSNYKTALDIWNKIAEQRPDITVIGIATSQLGSEAQLEQDFQFSVFAAQSIEELVRNQILALPMTLLVRRGGEVEKAWMGGFTKSHSQTDLATVLSIKLEPIPPREN